jgi:hypothetical protein
LRVFDDIDFKISKITNYSRLKIFKLETKNKKNS